MPKTHDLADMLTDLYGRHPCFKRVTIERLVARTADQYRDAAITAYVPLLVRREVTQQLRYIEEALDYELGGSSPAGGDCAVGSGRHETSAAASLNSHC